jgi:hypothetical protein
MPPPSSLIARSILLAVIVASLALTFGGSASADSSRGAGVLPTPAAAKAIVSDLWAQREGALALLNADMLAPYETAAARTIDGAYIQAVNCQCSPAKDAHPALQVIPEVPRSSVQPVFFAEVRTTNDRSKQHPWYVVAVARDAGHWKLAFVTLGSYGGTPLPELGGSGAPTPGVSAAMHARIARIAAYAATAATTRDGKVRHTDYGATVRTRAAVEAAKDGVYGLSLSSGTVLSCFTLHVLGTTTLAGGLQQGAAQTQWSTLLAPGAYKSITVDAATPQCMVGSGVGTHPGKLRMQYDETIVGVTGVPL